MIEEYFAAIRSRRNFMQNCAAALCGTAFRQRPFALTGSNKQHSEDCTALDQDWLFGGKWTQAAAQPHFDDQSFVRCTLPHTVTPLSWRNWNPSDWQDTWAYRRHFVLPERFRGRHIFLSFERIMAAANVTVNGSPLPAHLGGFLPFQHEITDMVRDGDNVIAVEVDARWLNVPPTGSPRGPASVDYLLPGGITGSVSLYTRPQIFIADVVARARNVLTPERTLDVTCRIDAKRFPSRALRLVATLHDGETAIASASHSIDNNHADQEAQLTLRNLQNVTLWDVDRPQLYRLEVTLLQDEKPLHTHRSRIGFRDARFEIDGFYLNGRRLQLFGLNRHELYPYIGFAAPPRLLRRDAEILRHNFNCNIVRCSHYPQSAAFLDACDELGLLVWEEVSGWQYIGDATWQQCVVRDVEAMLFRDRNRPSVVIWGVRVNESNNDPKLYEITRERAKSLDPTRPTSGTMTPDSLKTWKTEWHQDVFAFDDYHAEPDGSVGILPPLPGVPYLVAETVGQFNYEDKKNFNAKYRRAGDAVLQEQQALRHAQAHSRAANHPRCAGVIGWCAFDYASLMNADQAVKCPGVADVFRIPKLGALFYLAQCSPEKRVVIEPNFYWDSDLKSNFGRERRVAIFSNCDRLELFVGGKHHATLHADRAGFPHIQYPPFFADLSLDSAQQPDLRIDGYLGDKPALSRMFSADRSSDRLLPRADDLELIADGSDATWLIFGAVDKFGALRSRVDGEVSFTVDGPGRLIGDNPFQLEASGGWGAVIVQTFAGQTGQIRVAATHAHLGQAQVTIKVRNTA